VIAIVPSIGRSKYFLNLLTTIYLETTEIIVCDNSEEALTGRSVVSEIITRSGLDVTYIANHPETIYAGWNRGIRRSTELGVPVAVLNDDIILPKGSLTAAARALKGNYGLIGLNYFDPEGPVNRLGEVREVHGTYRTGGFGGFAFILPPGSPEVDDRYRWWAGDDDLGERVKAQGKKLGLTLGAPVSHPEPSTSGIHSAWTQQAAGEDLTLFRQMYPTAP